MLTRLGLTAVSAVFGMLLLQTPKSTIPDDVGDSAESVTQRYRAEIDQLENGANEILSTLSLLSEGMQRSDQNLSTLTESVHTMTDRLQGVMDTVKQTVEAKIQEGRFVSTEAMQEAIDEVKKVAQEAKTSSDGSTDSCNCEARFLEIFQRLEALENATGLTKTLYGSVSSSSSVYGSVSNVSSGGCTGSITTTTYNSQPAVVMAGGGCTGGYETQVQAYAPSVVYAPADTRNVRVVEPFQRRQVTEYEVPEPVAVTTCENGQCDTVQYQAPAKVTQSRGLFQRMFRGR